jgi:DNA-binding LacI/PurR family transcriptional regulator
VEISAAEWTAAAGYEAGRALADDPDVTAVLAANDVMALGVIKALTESGLRVPEDISVVGFDDREEVPYFRPALTSVRLDFTEVGRLAVEKLLLAIAGETPQPIPILQPELKVRSSSAPPRASQQG